jgi:hypothetical protein
VIRAIRCRRRTNPWPLQVWPDIGLLDVARKTDRPVLAEPVQPVVVAESGPRRHVDHVRRRIMAVRLECVVAFEQVGVVNQPEEIAEQPEPIGDVLNDFNEAEALAQGSFGNSAIAG